MYNIHNYNVCVCSDDDWKRMRMRWRRDMMESQTAKRRKERSGRVRGKGGREGDKGGGGGGGGR